MKEMLRDERFKEKNDQKSKKKNKDPSELKDIVVDINFMSFSTKAKVDLI